MDIQKEREAFEATQNPIVFERIVYIEKANLFTMKDDFRDDLFTVNKCNELNFGWSSWQAAKAQAVPEWISVEDGLPSDGQNIIAFDAIKHCVFKDGEFLQGYFEPDTGHEYEEPVEVTHWMAVEAQESTND